jgi:pyrimidine-nucleoside phosphorylase
MAENPNTFLGGIVVKRDGGELAEDFYKHFMPSIASGEIPDYQVSAWLMAIFLKGMSSGETGAMTQAIARSGKIISFPHIKQATVDKHSTGGVGDKITFLVAPLVSACGVMAPLTAGRGLGHTGGTIDKLESIPGVRTQFTAEEMEGLLERVGWLICAQSKDIAPADGVLYRLRNATGTVSSLPLVVSSIMGKKLAVENDGLVLDVKFGSGAFFPEVEKARELSRTMVEIGKSAGRTCRAVLTNMEQPLGRAVGNSLELTEAIELLKGTRKDCPDVVEVTLALGAQMLIVAGLVNDEKEGRDKLLQAWGRGEGYDRLVAMVSAQGGDVSYLHQPQKFPQAKNVAEFKAPASGFITAIDARRIGELARRMGAGREYAEQEIDRSVGIVFRARVGEEVRAGEVLAVIYFNGVQKSEYVAELSGSITIGEQPPDQQPLILEVVS